RKQPFTAIALLDSAEYKLGRIEELSDLKRQLLVEVGLYDKAIAESNAMIAEYPWSPGNYRILASLYARTNKDSLALSAYNQALAIDSTDIETLSSLAAFYRKKSDVSNFFAATRKMIASDDMDLQAKLSLVNELKSNRAFYQDNFFQVRDLISLLLIKYPTNYEVIDLYGQTIIASSGAEQAAEFYKSHLKDKDVPVSIFNTVLDMETYLKRPDSVAKYNALALERFPHETELYLRQGGSSMYMEDYPKAMESFKAAYKHAATDSLRSATLVMIGEIYHRQGNDKKCFQSYDKALRLDPNNAVALNNYSYFLATTGPDGKDLDKSVEMAIKATTLSPGNATYLDTYAWALFKAGRLPEAKKVMQQAVSLDTTDSSELMIHYGDILYALKEYFMASIYWNKALERDHDKAEIEQRLKLVESK
ncbi:MAG: tetratricopeptide repeat protein, partial [Rikenellaceae bacterium]|nr:tetratricopeptide repeat protein [Rikenellaceae bacterium]